MKPEKWIRKEEMFGTFLLVGKDGFGSSALVPDQISEVNAVFSTSESPFYFSRAFSTAPLFEIDREFTELSVAIAEQLEAIHKACRQSRFREPPPCWSYPFVKPADFVKPTGFGNGLSNSPFYLHHQARKALQELLATPLGTKFHMAICEQTALLRRGWNKQADDILFIDEVIILESFNDSAASSRRFVLVEGNVWSSELELSAQQWLDAVRYIEEDKKSEIKSFVEQLGKRSVMTTNPRPAIPELVRNEVWRRDEGRCVQCGGNERLEYDHIIPVIRGGSHTARNLQLLCETCNRIKGSSI